MLVWSVSSSITSSVYVVLCGSLVFSFDIVLIRNFNLLILENP